ncbi:hypothetical protein TrLO_g12301 [Triparma laevis f. longispina]|uniref:2-(3-amino-3-carboxypropyl)histidine synthase subunit 2 n=1 Tax=Triparma laevis f. longispina TaxID=1714387 RepID=A0A9W7FQV2_9STRA|nr:hypothetical protein TrLO_g12301 [Triparma laevis f. longispina]
MSQTTAPRLEMNDGARLFTDVKVVEIVKSDRPDEYGIEEYYEISSTASKIHSAYLSSPVPLLKIALQFPDSLLPDSSPVSLLLESTLMSLNPSFDLLIFILGDTTYGSCCVDTIAAKHLNADIVIHYGNSCLSRVKDIPSINVFGRCPIDINDLIVKVEEKEVFESEIKNNDTIIVTYDVKFSYIIDEVVKELRERWPKLDIVKGDLNDESENIQFTNVDNNDNNNNNNNNGCGDDIDSCACKNSPQPPPPPTPLTIPSNSNNKKIAIGGLLFPSTLNLLTTTVLHLHHNNLKHLTNIHMKTTSSKTHLTYHTISNTLEKGVSKKVGRQLNRRFYLTQKVRSTNIIGIVIATLNIDKFHKVVKDVKSQIEESGRTCYVFCVGKVNVAKLANYGEVEAFCLIACPENSLLDSGDFHVPVVTPFELEIGLGLRGWGDYSVEFLDYLRKEEVEEVEDADEPIYDVVTGTYVERKKKEVDLTQEVGGGQVTTFKSEAGRFLNNREYTGLESNIGTSEVRKAVKGQVGIASEYDGKDLEVETSVAFEKTEGVKKVVEEDSDDSGDFILGGITSMTMDMETSNVFEKTEVKKKLEVEEEEEDSDDSGDFILGGITSMTMDTED